MEKGGDAALVCVGLDINLTLLSWEGGVSTCLAYLLSEIFLLSKSSPPPPSPSQVPSLGGFSCPFLSSLVPSVLRACVSAY